jgi:hypothetical protein
LEGRVLPSGPSATWLGQDGHDLVGGPSPSQPADGVQDIHIAITGLPAGRTVALAVVMGAGRDAWAYNAPSWNPWTAALLRAPGASTADLFINPIRVETGRVFQIQLVYDDQSTSVFYLNGGTADPGLRMPGDAVKAAWLGQDGQDWTGPGPGVGPDGFQDVHLALSHLAAGMPIDSVTVTAPSGTAWQSGLNPDLDGNAQLIRNAGDPTRADLYFSPVGNLAGQTLTVRVVYDDGQVDLDSTTVVAGPTDPSLRMPRPAPVALTWGGFAASWVGQDGQNLEGPGDVHVAISGLPAGRSIVSASLSDEARQSWNDSASGAGDPLAPYALPMVLRASPSDPTRADLDFPPVRDESGSTLMLRLVLDNGAVLVDQFAGGPADPGLRAPGPAPTSVVAHPGDDLEALVSQFGTVHLTAGVYALDQPLVLNQAVAITADPGATLLFTQGASAPLWTAAIKINQGHTTLDGFAVRFGGPVRWNRAVSYSPAVIGTTDDLDPGPGGLKVDVVLTHLDLQSPPPATASETAPSLMRLVTAQSGVVADNTLKGGTVEFMGGPWQIVGNDDLGTVPGTDTAGAFGGHYTHDVLIADNHVEPTGPSGKTWRFLVMTQGGVDDVVRDNVVVGVGPMDSDPPSGVDAPEVLLTESYRLHFEGAPAAVSPDGRVLQIPTPEGGPASTGDVVAVLAGPGAGQWRMIAQALSPTAYLLDSPLPAGSSLISISQAGFVDETYQGNTIDARGSSTATDLVLPGNQYGARVMDNHLLGGGSGFALAAYPTEIPDIWGWSHAPFLGAVIEGNTIEDTLQGGQLDVTHSVYTKSNQGRVYFSATLDDNTVVWTDAFLAKHGAAGPPPALSAGDSLSHDPGELLLSAQGNQVEVSPDVKPGAVLEVASAVVNGQPMVNLSVVLPTVPPAPPSGLRLVNDNGISATDGITSDARLRFDTTPRMPGYEYSLTGAEGTYQPVTSADAFLPAGLTQGFDTVFVRAYDATGHRGPAEVIAFVDDLSPVAQRSGAGRAGGRAYEYRIGNSGSFVPLGAASAIDPSLLAGGPPPLQVRTAAGAGHPLASAVSTSPSQVMLAQAAGAAGTAGPPAVKQPDPPKSPFVRTAVPVISVRTSPTSVFGHNWVRSGHRARPAAAPRAGQAHALPVDGRGDSLPRRRVVADGGALRRVGFAHHTFSPM